MGRVSGRAREVLHALRMHLCARRAPLLFPRLLAAWTRHALAPSATDQAEMSLCGNEPVSNPLAPVLERIRSPRAVADHFTQMRQFHADERMGAHGSPAVYWWRRVRWPRIGACSPGCSPRLRKAATASPPDSYVRPAGKLQHCSRRRTTKTVVLTPPNRRDRA